MGPLRAVVPLKEDLPPFSLKGFTVFVSYAMRKENDVLCHLISRFMKAMGFMVVSASESSRTWTIFASRMPSNVHILDYFWSKFSQFEKPFYFAGGTPRINTYSGVRCPSGISIAWRTSGVRVSIIIKIPEESLYDMTRPTVPKKGILPRKNKIRFLTKEEADAAGFPELIEWALSTKPDYEIYGEITGSLDPAEVKRLEEIFFNCESLPDDEPFTDYRACLPTKRGS